jgi:hypothetical protein
MDNKQKLEKYSYNRKRTVFFVYKLEHKIRKKKNENGRPTKNEKYSYNRKIYIFWCTFFLFQ